jgi:nicotinamidase-related amidase
MHELTFEPHRTALVIIDLQKGITRFEGAPHSTHHAIANCVELLNVSRKTGVQPILVHVDFSPGGHDALHVTSDEPMRATGNLPPDWSEFLPELNHQPGDIAVLKRQWGAFYGTDLELQLRRRGLTTIILCGIATEFGVESTARDAHERGFEQIFAHDAMTARSAESHFNAITHIFPRMGRVRSTNEIVAALRAGIQAA